MNRYLTIRIYLGSIKDEFVKSGVLNVLMDVTKNVAMDCIDFDGESTGGCLEMGERYDLTVTKRRKTKVDDAH